MKIKAGDQVVVITGKDKGKTGQVLRVLSTKGRLVVGGINMRTKHVKATPQQAGQRIQYEASIDVSNVMLVDPKTKKRTRAGYKIDPKKGKVRIAKKSGEALTVSKASAKTTKKSTAKDSKKDEKETKAKTTKKAAKAEEKKEESASDSKQPFWKKLGFGSEAAAQAAGADVTEPSHMMEDHSVPDQTQRSSGRTHSRGK